MSDTKKPGDNEKLPQIDETSVEEIPAADLDDVAGGLTDSSCNCTKACTSTKVSKSTMLD
jgi:hypothetical protein